MTDRPADSVFQPALSQLLVEIFDGPPGNEAYILNPGDPGLLRQLDAVDAETASVHPTSGKTTIAQHVDHLRFGLSLLNRWSSGEENPWADADWGKAWHLGQVDAAAWQALRDDLRREVADWQQHFAGRTSWDRISAAGAISSVAHTAYHLGAIRQLLAAV